MHEPKPGSLNRQEQSFCYSFKPAFHGFEGIYLREAKRETNFGDMTG
jgi:hypothetical protein